MLWFVGLPGLIAAGAVVIHACRRGWQAARAGLLPWREYEILLGYVVCMYLTGLSVAGVFLGFPFFYFLGILASSRRAAPAGQIAIT
jgi:hypothetical protein